MNESLINRIHNEDCLDTMAKMDDESIDLTVTSPPYGSIRLYHGFSFNFHEIAKELYRVTKKGGGVIWQVGDQTKNGSESGDSFRQALYFMECGFLLYDTMLYRKENYPPQSHRRYEQEFEYMFAFFKGKPNTFNPLRVDCKLAGQTSWGKPNVYKTNDGTKTRSKRFVVNQTKVHGNIFSYKTGSLAKGTSDHPARFPDDLPYDQIQTWTVEGDIVYDCFMGSGTTAVGAIKANRRYVGSEVSSVYCDIANKRIAETNIRLL